MQSKKILIPVNGNESDDAAFWLARELTRKSKGKIYIVYVIEMERSLPLDADVTEKNLKGENILQRVEKLAKEANCKVEGEILQARDAGPAIVQEAMDKGVNVIAMSIGYKNRYGEFRMGSTIAYILKNAPCHVLLHRSDMDIDA